MADLKISALNSLAGADLVAADVVAVVDDSASETKKLTVSDLIANGSTLISDNTIPSAKILFAAGAIDTAELAASAVETAKINDSAVTAAKLADNSSVTLVSTLPASGAFTGQIALDTDDNKIYIWDGSAWDSVKGAGSINVVNGSTTGEINIVASTSGDTVTISATLDDTTAAAQFLGGPTGAGGTVGYRALVGTDLPTASTTAKGGVIVNGNGLTMSSDTIAIDNTVTAETTENHIVQYDANGLITSGRAIAAADVPVATSTTIGVVKPGSGLGVTGAGELNHDNSVTAGTAAKVTFDTEGHITGTESLVAADIPDLDAAKITSGAFPTARIASDAITADKLANYTVAQISETTPTADFTSQFFFNPITRDLFLWDGNVFQPVGISAGEIVLAGTYDASTNLLDSVTADGTAAGFTNGASLPAAATGNNRHYVVVSQSGTGSAPAPTVTLEPPDILLSNGTSYVLIETSETITAQIASNVGFTPTGNIAGTNVQAAVAEVDSEKLAKGGDTMTGDLTLNNVNIVFEGATENEYETTLTVTDPTADRTITLPNVTGTVVTTGDTGSVTSTMITDGTIVNADINASAEIAVSKLANGTARQLLQTDVAGSGVEFTSNIDVPGTLDVTGAATLDSTLGVTGLISADGKVKFPAGTAAAPSLYPSSDTDTGIYSPGSDQLAISTGGTGRLFVRADGQIGINTSTPACRLQVNGGTDNTIVQLTSTDAGSYIAFEDDSTTGSTRLGALANDLRFEVNSSEAARIDSSGNVGIGVSSPDGRLHVQDTANDLQIRVGGTTAGRDPLIRLQGRNTADNTNVYADIKLDSDNQLLLLNDPGTTGGTIGQNPVAIDSSGRVLIGTTTEGAAAADNLTIADSGHCGITIRSGTTHDGAIYFSDATSGAAEYDGYIYYTQNSRNLIFGTAQTEAMRIDSSGNVGIGTTSPNTKLVVNDGSNALTSSVGNINVISTDSAAVNTGGSIGLGGFYNGTTNSIPFANIHGKKENSTGNDAAGYFAIATRNASSGTAERMRIDSSGKVGVGVTNPQTGLHISDGSSLAAPQTTGAGRLTVQNSSSADIQLMSANTGFNHIFFGDQDDANVGSIHYIHSSNAMVFATNASEQMRIDSSGRLLVGTSSSSASTTLVLEGNSASSTSTGVITLARGTSAPGNGATLGEIDFAANNHNAPAAWIYAARDGGTWTSGSSQPSVLVFSTTADGASTPTQRMRIASDGQLRTLAAQTAFLVSSATGAGTSEYLIGGQYSASSPGTGTNSFRVYTNGNVQNTNNSYGAISDAKLKENIVDASSQWDDLKAIQVRNYNFIEGQTHTQIGVVAQEVETVSPGLVTESPDTDEEGNDLGTTTKSVNYSVLYMKAVKALQEAMDRIETLEAKVAALEAE